MAQLSVCTSHWEYPQGLIRPVEPFPVGFPLALTPRGGKEQTGRDLTPNRSIKQDRLAVKHSEEPQLPTSGARLTAAQHQGLWKGRQVGARRRKSTSSGMGGSAAQHDSAAVSNDQEPWHKPAC